MGRKQNRIEEWNRLKAEKRRRKLLGRSADDTNVRVIDPAQQKADRLRRRKDRARALHLQTLRESKAKKESRKRKSREQNTQKTQEVLQSMQNSQLDSLELDLLVSAKHKETKREKVRRLFAAKKAGLEVDSKSVLYEQPQETQQSSDECADPWDFGALDVSEPSKDLNESSHIETASGQRPMFGSCIGRSYLHPWSVAVESTSQEKRGQIKEVTVLDRRSEAEKLGDYSLVLPVEREDDVRSRMYDGLTAVSKPQEESEDDSSDSLSEGDEELFGVYGGDIKERAKQHRRALKKRSLVEMTKSDDSSSVAKGTVESPRRKAVTVRRTKKIDEERMGLPVVSEESRIMEAVHLNDVVIICGETGSGKSTQIPQFLFEHGYASQGLLIGVTEPRRVAAMSVASRVREELNVKDKRTVAYQIRYDSSQVSSQHTRIKFMTDGILLREVQSDHLLLRYSAIILDEAHERKLNTDVLIGLLSRIVRLRRKKSDQGKNEIRPLKMIIMSATLKVSDFIGNESLFPTDLCSAPPVLKIPARQFPVTVHFNKKTPLTEQEYMDDVFNKVSKIHVTLPRGHILVFLTGRRQIEEMCMRLRRRFQHATLDELREEEQTEVKEGERSLEEEINESDEEDDHSDEDDENDDDGNEKESGKDNRDCVSNWRSRSFAAVRVCGLYSSMPAEKQSRVFESVPKGQRLIVVATNVAETSITIPGVRYVVDCGRAKQLRFNPRSNLSTMEIGFISQASATQRAGRAGRTGPGHAYRLYSSAFFHECFPLHFEPEISRVGIESTVLRLKNMNVGCVSDFPLPTPPERDAVLGALRTLEVLDAVRYDSSDFGDKSDGLRTSKLIIGFADGHTLLKSDEERLKITPLGRALVDYPLGVRCAKMVTLASQGGCLPFVLGIVALLSVDELQYSQQELHEHMTLKETITERRRFFEHPKSDVLSELNMLGALSATGDHSGFCRKFFLRSKTALECLELAKQLRRVLSKMDNINLGPLDMPHTPPNDRQYLMLRQIIASGQIDQIARRWSSIGDNQESNFAKHSDDWSAASTQAAARKLHCAYQCMSEASEPVFIHPSSHLSPERKKLSGMAPEWLVYSSLQRGQTSDFGSRRLFMRGVTVIEPHWLPNLAPQLCEFGEPLDKPRPFYDADADEVRCFVEVRFGVHQWPLPLQSRLLANEERRIRLFAKFFLEGRVFTQMARFKKHLRLNPALLESESASMTGVARELISELRRCQVWSKRSLREAWLADGDYLKSEVAGWLFADQRHRLERVFPFRK